MIFNILTNFLGNPKSTLSPTHFSFNCPNCAALYNYGQPDNNFNLEIDLNKEGYEITKVYHCWKCQAHGSLYSLVRKYASREDRRKYLEFDLSSMAFESRVKPVNQIVCLPQIFMLNIIHQGLVQL